jgi:hypothetical protein
MSEPWQKTGLLSSETLRRLKGWIYLRAPVEDWEGEGLESDPGSVIEQLKDNEEKLLYMAVAIAVTDAQKKGGTYEDTEYFGELCELGISEELVLRMMQRLEQNST